MGGKDVYYDHIPLYFKCATKENATFWFEEKKQEGIVRLERDGRVYYSSPGAQCETVLIPGTEEGFYVIQPEEPGETETVISFRVLPQCTQVQQRPSLEPEFKQEVILNEGGESVTFRAKTGDFQPIEVEKLRRLWENLDTAQCLAEISKSS